MGCYERKNEYDYECGCKCGCGQDRKCEKAIRRAQEDACELQREIDALQKTLDNLMTNLKKAERSCGNEGYSAAQIANVAANGAAQAVCELCDNHKKGYCECHKKHCGC